MGRYFSWFAVANAPMIVSTRIDTLDPSLLKVSVSHDRYADAPPVRHTLGTYGVSYREGRLHLTIHDVYVVL